MAINDLFYKVESLKKIEVEIEKASSRYSTLSELWDSKSKAKIHLDISKKMAEVLLKLEHLRKFEKEITIEIQKS